jgi:hypothetical protein
MVVTLCNGALCVLRHLVGVENARTRTHVETYGVRVRCRFVGRAVRKVVRASSGACRACGRSEGARGLVRASSLERMRARSREKSIEPGSDSAGKFERIPK